MKVFTTQASSALAWLRSAGAPHHHRRAEVCLKDSWAPFPGLAKHSSAYYYRNLALESNPIPDPFPAPLLRGSPLSPGIMSPRGREASCAGQAEISSPRS